MFWSVLFISKASTNPDFKQLDVEELCAHGEESKDSDQENDDREDDNDH